jgi:hypothetical protein
MRPALKLGLLLLVATMLGGCTSFSPAKVTGEPSQVTIEAALESVGKGLSGMRTAIGDGKTGLVPAEVTVTFKLAASATESNKLTVDLSVPITSGGVAGTAKAGGEASGGSEGTRSNEISIKFVNIMLLPKDTLATLRSPAEIADLLKVLAGQGITPMVPQ